MTKEIGNCQSKNITLGRAFTTFFQIKFLTSACVVDFLNFLKLLLEKCINIDISYMDRCRIYQGMFLSIIQVKNLTCACAVQFCGFLEKYSKYIGGLIGFERKLAIAYPTTLYIFTPSCLRSQTRACTYSTFSKIQSILFFITH